MQNNTCIIGVELNAQKVFRSHKFKRRDISLLINCVIDDALLEMMPDIDEPLFQFIDVMNLLDPLLHFSHIFAVNRVHICAVGWQKVW